MASAAKGPAASKGANDADIARHSQTMLDEGRKTFRYDTFGSEAFWGDALQLHKAIAGEKNGGVGAGVSPETALAVGLKVDADALPDALKKQIKAGQGRPRGPGHDRRAAEAQRGRRRHGVRDPDGGVKSMGIQCALCHSTVDDSFAPGIGKRLDGWANRDLNVGAIVSLAPNLKPFTDLLGVDEATVKKVLASWGPGRYDALLDKDGKALRPDGKQAAVLIPPAFGLAGVNLHTWTGFGSVPYWNAYVARPDARLGRRSSTRASPTRRNTPSRARAARTTNARTKPDRVDGQAGRAALLPAGDPGAQAARGLVQRGRVRTRQGRVRRARGRARRCHVPPLFTEPGHNVHAPERDRHRLVPGRSLAHPRLSHRAARGPVVAPEGRLLSRRPFRDADGRRQSLRHVHEAGPQRARTRTISSST